MKKYFKSRSEAKKAADERNSSHYTFDIHVFKMPRGSRHVGQFFVGTHLEYLHFAN